MRATYHGIHGEINSGIHLPDSVVNCHLRGFDHVYASLGNNSASLTVIGGNELGNDGNAYPRISKIVEGGNARLLWNCEQVSAATLLPLHELACRHG